MAPRRRLGLGIGLIVVGAVVAMILIGLDEPPGVLQALVAMLVFAGAALTVLALARLFSDGDA